MVYLREVAGQLSDQDRARLDSNPLRVLDSKDPGMAAVLAAAPRISDHLCDACAEHYGGLREHLAGIENPLATQTYEIEASSGLEARR